jgi:OOP family OmpA-OmpF porin
MGSRRPESRGLGAVISSLATQMSRRLTSPLRGTRAGALAACLAAVALARPARATDCGPPNLSTCIDDDTLWPHGGASHFFSIGATDTVEAGTVGFGISTSYLSRPITLQLSTPGPGGTAYDVIDNQVNGSFLWSYGMTDRLEIDLVLPVTFGQNGVGTNPITGGPPQNALSGTATRDLRFGIAYALVKREPVDPYAPTEAGRPSGDGFGVALRFEMSAPTGDTGEFASNGTGVWLPGVSADYRYGHFFAGAELGARLRPTQQFEGARIGSQGYVALGAAWDVLQRELLTIGLEGFALPTFADQGSSATSATGGGAIVPAEWLLSARTSPMFGGDLQIQLGGGGSLPFTGDPITSPRFRFALSIRYARQGRDTDGDGVKDEDDKCPLVRGIRDNPAGNGCPSSASTERVDLSQVPAEPPPGAVAPVQVPVAPATPYSAPSSPVPGDAPLPSK